MSWARLRCTTCAAACLGSCYRLNASLLLFKIASDFRSLASHVFGFRHEIWGIAFATKENIIFSDALRSGGITVSCRSLIPLLFFVFIIFYFCLVCRVAGVVLPIFARIRQKRRRLNVWRMESKQKNPQRILFRVCNKIQIYDAFSHSEYWMVWASELCIWLIICAVGVCAWQWRRPTLTVPAIMWQWSLPQTDSAAALHAAAISMQTTRVYKINYDLISSNA